jgi:flagellar biogenesis protein FliO
MTGWIARFLTPRCLWLMWLASCMLAAAPRSAAQQTLVPENDWDGSIVQSLMYAPDEGEIGRTHRENLSSQGMSITATNQLRHSVQTAAHSEYRPQVSLNQRTRLGSEPQPSQGTSFIERERAGQASTEQVNSSSTQALITRLAVNLAFVLAVVIGGILCWNRWQRPKVSTKSATGRSRDVLKICQVLSLGGQASLHMIRGHQHWILVAKDGGGIKSVQLISAFDEALDQEVRRGGPQLHTFDEPPDEEDDRATDSAEIDEKLIRLLLRGSQKAA